MFSQFSHSVVVAEDEETEVDHVDDGDEELGREQPHLHTALLTAVLALHLISL